MSSTGRGGRRREADYYPTPAWCVHRLLGAMPRLCKLGGTWFEPAAGDGAIIRAAATRLILGTRWSAMELRDAPRDTGGALVSSWEVGDYLSAPSPGVRYDVAITNPPFSLAMEFWRKMRSEAHGVLLLQRLSWVAPASRAREFRKDMPDVFVLPNRPSFTGKGTDSADYAWYTWGPRRNIEGRVVILRDTPLQERRKG